MVKDPVCGMEVDRAKARWKAMYGEKTYYFCSENCLKSFQEDPQKYIGKDNLGGR